jgi:D-aminoacyl-tRNA deacylase
MRAVVQRVSQASVTVGQDLAGTISEPGLLVFVGVTHGDTPEKAAKLAAKLWGLRSAAPGEIGAPITRIAMRKECCLAQ